MVLQGRRAVGRWYYVVAGLGLVWNLLGVTAFVMQVTMTPEALAALPEPQRELYEMTPVWATVAFALAVFGGVLGCLGLLLRKRWGLILLWFSLAGVLVQMFHAMVLSNSLAVYGPVGAVMPVLVIAIAIALVMLGRSANTKHWLG